MIAKGSFSAQAHLGTLLLAEVRGHFNLFGPLQDSKNISATLNSQ
jgi:hypothetical protein